MRQPAAALQLLDRDGCLRGEPGMTPDQIREALRLMLLSRALDELAIKLQRLRQIGIYAPVEGQEAAVVGSALALEPHRDWMVPGAREQPAMIRHGWPLTHLLAAYMGRLDHGGVPPGARLLPRQQAIAAQLPQAAGLAWALKLRREPAATMVYCGDGASSEGDFHEALNLAGAVRAPLVVVLVNNRYAISTPLERQTAATNLALRGPGYGIPGVAVDGNDLFAVHTASREAVERALGGEGPTLIECRTYRLGFHNTSDNPSNYRDRAEVEAARRADPIARLIHYVVRTGILGEDGISAMEHGVRTELEEARRHAASLPAPGPGYIFEHVYAHPPARLLRQREETLDGA